MRVAGESAPKYVLLVSVNPGGPNGGSGTQYFVGDFDGHEFRSDEAFRAHSPTAAESAPDSTARWVDYGPDDYAGVTWSGVPRDDGRTLFLGWMSNWQYAQKVPTTPWRSAMTVPRELYLVRTAQGLELRSRPVAELASLRDHSSQIRERAILAPLDLTKGIDLKSGLSEIVLDIDLREAGLVTLEFANQVGQKTLFRINRALGRYELDRSRSGDVSFDPQFGKTGMAPMHKAAGKISVHAFLDRSSLELFLNDGETVMTSVQFPSVPYDTVKLQSDKPAQLVSATIYKLKSIWTDK
jgi:fructan beta-fructosidase